MVNLVPGKPERIWVWKFSGANPHLWRAILLQAVATGERVVLHCKGNASVRNVGCCVMVGLLVLVLVGLFSCI